MRERNGRGGPDGGIGGPPPAELRARVRAGDWDGHTSGAALGYVQANVVILPKAMAGTFREFCLANPRSLPLVEMSEPGVPDRWLVAPGADIRTDVPRYVVYRYGEAVERPGDILRLWRDDFVAFLLGCSFTAEERLVAAGVRVPHLAAGRNVAMFVTDRSCAPAGPWHGPLVVSMRPIDDEQVGLATEVTARLPIAHGAPIHVGDPAGLGIADLAAPDYGDPALPGTGQTPMFWACGVTPQAVIAETAPELAITHLPGHMFVTDVPSESVLDRRPVLADHLRDVLPRHHDAER